MPNFLIHLCQAYGIELAPEAFISSSAPSDLQVYVAATNATLDKLRAHLQAEGKAHQRFIAMLENTNKDIALNNQKNDQIQTTLFCMIAFL